MDDAAFSRDRLQVATKRLSDRLLEVRAQEQDRRRQLAYDKARVERDGITIDLHLPRDLVSLPSRHPGALQLVRKLVPSELAGAIFGQVKKGLLHRRWCGRGAVAQGEGEEMTINELCRNAVIAIAFYVILVMWGRLVLAMRRYLILAAAILATCGPARAEPIAPEIHFAPVESLEHIDVALLRSATKSIDLTAYVLTDWAIIAALQDARQRGVSVRIVLDPHEWQPYDRLTGLDVRVKRRGPLMNLKAYALDGTVLRTGSANFSASGEKQQDNDLIILWDSEATAKFEARFSEIWTAAEPMGGKE